MEATDKFIKVKALSPNVTSYMPSYTMPVYGTLQEKARSVSPTNSVSSSTALKSNKKPTSKRQISIDNHADLIVQTGECLTPNSTKAQVEQNFIFNPKAADHPENENCMRVYTQNVHGL